MKSNVVVTLSSQGKPLLGGNFEDESWTVRWRLTYKDQREYPRKREYDLYGGEKKCMTKRDRRWKDMGQWGGHHHMESYRLVMTATSLFLYIIQCFEKINLVWSMSNVRYWWDNQVVISNNNWVIWEHSYEHLTWPKLNLSVSQPYCLITM